MTEEEIEVTRGWPRDDDEQQRYELPEHRGSHVTLKLDVIARIFNRSRKSTTPTTIGDHGRDDNVRPNRLRVFSRAVHIFARMQMRCPACMRVHVCDTPRLERASLARACDFARKRAVINASRVASFFLTARCTRVPRHTPRVIRRRDTPTREKRATVVVSIARRGSTRIERCAHDGVDRTKRRGMLRSERNVAHGERAACLPRESHNQLCATIAMGRLGSAQARRPRAAEHGRSLPRPTYENQRRGRGRGRACAHERSNHRSSCSNPRPELNLKSTDGNIARENGDTVGRISLDASLPLFTISINL